MDRVFVIDGPVRARAAYEYIAAHWLEAVRRGTPLVVSVEQQHRQRTIAQNKRLHALISEIAAYPIHGHTFSPEAVKEWIRRRFIGTEEIDLPDGTRIERGISTTTLSVDECQKLMEQIEAWAATELGIEFHT